MTLAEMLNMANQASSGVEVNTNTGYTPLPAGVYSVAVTNATGPVASKRANPANPNEFGQYIKLEFTVTEGEHTNRKLFSNNNILVYPKSLGEEDVRRAQMAMAMGSKERELLLTSIGKTAIEQAEELIGATAKVKVVVAKDTNGADRNEIKSIMASGSTSTPATTPAPAPAATTTAKPKMPWEK